MVKILNEAKTIHPHLIVVIENPRALMAHMPLMKELERSFGLYRTTVDYCAFGRFDKKPTDLWTNVRMNWACSNDIMVFFFCCITLTIALSLLIWMES